MKKIFSKALVVLAFLSAGTGLSSCDSETLSTILPYVLQLLMGGQTQTYSGTAEVEGLIADGTNADGSTKYKYMEGGEKKTVTASASVQVSQNTATITLTQVEIGGRTLTNLQVAGVPIENGVLEGGYQWAYTCERQYGANAVEQISVTEENQATYHYDLLSGSIQSTTDNSAILTFEACVYMGNEAYNIKYTGQLVQQ
ncbi:MAG: hypothetical protein J5663_04175 [Bacteroidaceae bacterium]|nr:hypothetical protein [Bacteroidaceae bacterium]